MNDHFYTTDSIERDNALTGRYEGEGIACHVFANQAANTVPLHRAFKASTNDHYYTTSLADLHYAMLHQGYQYEGVACFVFEGPQTNTVPLLVLYNTASGDNFYTTSLPEAQGASINFGYNFLGTACWVFDQPTEGTVPFFRLHETFDTFVTANLIAVTGDTWTAVQWQEFLDGFSGAAAIYRNFRLRLQGAGTFDVPTAQAGGYAVIDSKSEAHDLTEDWNGPEGAVDVFCVPVFVGDIAGQSPENGPCEHDSKSTSGSIVERIDPLNVIIAHELGHYLGLGHLDIPNNLMRPSADPSNVLLLPDQLTIIKKHCYVHRV